MGLKVQSRSQSYHRASFRCDAHDGNHGMSCATEINLMLIPVKVLTLSLRLANNYLKVQRKKLLVSVWAPRWDFFPTMRPAIVFRINKWIKKILNRKKKLKKRKKNDVSWKRKKLGQLSLFTFIKFHINL